MISSQENVDLNIEHLALRWRTDMKWNFILIIIFSYIHKIHNHKMYNHNNGNKTKYLIQEIDFIIVKQHMDWYEWFCYCCFKMDTNISTVIINYKYFYDKKSNHKKFIKFFIISNLIVTSFQCDINFDQSISLLSYGNWGKQYLRNIRHEKHSILKLEI